MRRSHLAACLFLVGCAAPAILGHDDPNSITQTCVDGTPCPAWALCPTAPGGRCESPSQPPYSWGPENIGKHRALDAGAE
jgi:hypothetical protein